VTGPMPGTLYSRAMTGSFLACSSSCRSIARIYRLSLSIIKQLISLALLPVAAATDSVMRKNPSPHSTADSG
jgi:hypothetical protein